MNDLVSAALDVLDEGSAILRVGHSRNLRWANSALTTNGDMHTTNLTVVASDAGRVAVLSGQVSDPPDAVALATAARDAMREAAPVDAVPLPAGQPQPGASEPPMDLDQEVTDTMLRALGVFLESDAAQFGYAEVDRVTTYLGTTSGTAIRHVQDGVRFEASARDDTGSTWWGTNTWDADFASAAASQRRDLQLQASREELAPGRHRVILTPSAVADLLIYLAWSANGRDAVEGHNVFSRAGGTRVGESLTERALTLYADPSYPGLQTNARVVVEANSSMESVFDNGLPLARQELLRDGTLVGLRASRPTAARCGLSPLYLADNLILDDAAGHGGLEDLIARTDDAVLVNCLWYIREVDPQTLLLTGLTRDGVYRVRDGRIVAALPNFRFNVAVPDLLGKVLDASGTGLCLPREWADWFVRTAMPALLVEDFNLSSASDAR